MGRRTRSRNSRSRHRHSRRCMHGGDSAAEYMLKTVGAGNRQYDDTFRQGVHPGQSNAIWSLSGKQAGGRRRRRKRGGTFLSSALVPASLLAASYMYSRRKGRGSRSDRRTRRRFRGGFRGNNLSVSHPLSPAPYPGGN